MIKPHTAQSLGKYLGQKFIVEPYTFTLVLFGINFDRGIFSFRTESGSNLTTYRTGDSLGIYPILKDYTQLIVPMLHEGVEILPIEWIYGLKNSQPSLLDKDHWNYKWIHGMDWSCGGGKWQFNMLVSNEFEDNDHNLKLKMIQKLQALGFGAIKCEESPTGYRDLWNNPCVLDEGK